MSFKNPFKLNIGSNLVSSALEFVLGLKPLIKRYDDRPDNATPKQFLEHTLTSLNVDVKFSYQEGDSQIPTEGPLVVVANHPLGGLEGVAIANELLRVRPDVQVLTNELLTKISELSEIFIGVDVLSEHAEKKNLKGIIKATKHLKNGGAILIFPAGKVSELSVTDRKISDSEWNRIAGSLVKKYNATCLPMFVNGRNSTMFYAMGLIHKKLRTAMLGRELSNKRGSTLEVIVGSVIKPADLISLNDDESVTNYLRLSCELLSAEGKASNRVVSLSDSVGKIEKSPPSQNAIEKLQSLDEFKLLDSKNFSVYCVPYNALGEIMELIGIARERTFREVGEGTGNDIDTDQFDPFYNHLFVWDNSEQQIVGGYRIGCVKDIVENSGLDSLYTRSLYNYEQSFLDNLGSALEMGRSFITPDYQRHPTSLDLLWKGIGAFVAQRPQYHTLFGAVSVSSEYSALARAFISESMLSTFKAEDIYTDDVQPKKPFKVKGKLWTAEILASLNNIAVINKLVGRCDPGKSVPILLKQYLALNGRFVTFTVNEGFNDALDGLIVLDLRNTPTKYLSRYLGKQGHVSFLNHWNIALEGRV